MKNFILKVLAIWKKNFINHMANKKKFLSEFIFPVLVSLIYYFKKGNLLIIQNNKMPTPSQLSFFPTFFSYTAALSTPPLFDKSSLCS